MVDHNFGFVYLILFVACYIILADDTVIGHNKVMHLNFLIENMRTKCQYLHLLEYVQ